MKNQAQVLIVDDDQKICDLLSDFLSRHGYAVSVANDGLQMKKLLKNKIFQIIILDVMMPGEDGLTLCRYVRNISSVPIIILSAIGEETDRIIGLELGADDYLSKPFNPHELLARMKAVLRRAENLDAHPHQKQKLTSLPDISFLHWTLNQNRRILISPDGLTIPLSAGEYDLLMTFVHHAGRVLSRDQLLELTREKESSPFDRTIDVQVGRLRKKLEDDRQRPKIIVTLRSQGYLFKPKVEIKKENV